MVAAPSHQDFGPWNPGIVSQVPAGLRPLATLFRPENSRTPFGAALELQQLTGFAAAELVAFQPRRLALHELLVRVTADFSVPDGSRIEDLGINFREIIRSLLAGYLEPRMARVTGEFTQLHRQLSDSIRSAFCDVIAGGSAKAFSADSATPSWLSRLLMTRGVRRHDERAREGPANLCGSAGWGLREVAECDRRAAAAHERAEALAVAGAEPPGAAVSAAGLQHISYKCLARVMSALFTVNGQPWGTHELIVSLATDLACNIHGGELIGEFIEPILQRAASEQHYVLLPSQPEPVVINTKGPSASGKSTLRPLQKRLAAVLGVRWSDFALISPDIWRKQLLDYSCLGPPINTRAP